MSLRTMPPVVGHHDPDTSHKAAAVDRTSLRRQVQEILEANPNGLTDWEIWDATGRPGWDKPSVVNRRRECGAVETELRRPSPTGHPCVVWVLPA